MNSQKIRRYVKRFLTNSTVRKMDTPKRPPSRNEINMSISSTNTDLYVFSPSSTDPILADGVVRKLSSAARRFVAAFGTCLSPSVKEKEDGYQYKEISITSTATDRSRSPSVGSYKSSVYDNTFNANSKPVTMTFTMAGLRKATRNFSPYNQIGEGDFGIVYKGKLEDGSVVAIKRAKKEYP